MTTEAAIPAGMGRCGITGKIVPEDELVTLQGQRVCAEGKAILLERLKAGEALPGEAERPSVFRRFACIFVDGLLLAIPVIVFNLVAGFTSVAAGSAGRLVLGMAQLVGIAIGITYFTLLHGTRGQTLGKMAGKLKVVRLDGLPMDIKTAFIRALGYEGINVLPAIFIMIAGPSLLQAVGSLIVGIYSIVNVLFALFDRNQQRALHDHIAGTRVITIGS